MPRLAGKGNDMRGVGLVDGVPPLGGLQIDIGPFGFAQIPGPHEDQGSQPQGTTHDQLKLT